MENNAVKEAIQYLEKQKAAIEEALAHLTAAEPEEVHPEIKIADIPVPQTRPYRFSAEARRRMSLAQRHRWELKRQMAPPSSRNWTSRRTS